MVAALACCLAAIAVLGSVAAAQAADKKPNILVIWGDDIGYWNVSAYNQGMMGYKTPNIDRIAKEGALFTDWYGQQSCTAGRAAFITGQVGFRTGLLKVGLPGAKEGLQAARRDDCPAAQGAGLHDRAVRQEPPRRPRRARCRPRMASTSSSARSTTSTPRKSPRIPDYFKDPGAQARSTARAA